MAAAAEYPQPIVRRTGESQRRYYGYWRTQAHVLGVDIAAGAVTRAKERTRDRRSRLRFQVGDLDDLRFPAACCDTLVAIDSLYFVENLENTLGEMRDMLAPGGQMGIWFTETIGPEDSRELLLAKGTRLAQVLRRHDLDFQTWDFSDDEKEHWSRTLQIAGELKDAFAAEGNRDLCENRIREAERVLQYVESDRIRRYLYHVTTAHKNSRSG